jgi:hypothetical protein
VAILMNFFRRAPAPRCIDEDEGIDLFVPLDELDAHCAADEATAATGALVPAMLDGVAPGLSVVAHGLTMLAEITDALAPRPSPQAISEATRAYLQQPMRTRLGERAGVWVRVLGPRRRRATDSPPPKPAPVDDRLPRLRLRAPRPSWAR